MEAAEVKLNVPCYNADSGLRLYWCDGFTIATRIAEDGSIVLSANREGVVIIG